ncbi:MAG: AfsR/SARP family transcriptional regulator [Gemmatimonadales bacterium]
MLQLRVLGAASLGDEAGGEVYLTQPKRLALLAVLAVAPPPRVVRRDTLVALFWPELDHLHARASLRQAVHALRAVVGAHALVSFGDEELRLAPGHLWCDVEAFESLLRNGRLSDALDLYRGDFLEGFFISGAPGFERWVEQLRSRLCAQAFAGAQALVEQHQCSTPELAAFWARRALTLAPYDEVVLRRLIALRARLGDRVGAIHAYEEFSRHVALDLGVEPSEETKELVRALHGGGKSDRSEFDTRQVNPGVNVGGARGAGPPVRRRRRSQA